MKQRVAKLGRALSNPAASLPSRLRPAADQVTKHMPTSEEFGPLLLAMPAS
jgi:hypothetical protein